MNASVCDGLIDGLLYRLDHRDTQRIAALGVAQLKAEEALMPVDGYHEYIVAILRSVCWQIFCVMTTITKRCSLGFLTTAKVNQLIAC
jgi:hypothetical protein